MRDIYEVTRQKEVEMRTVKMQVEALKITIALLEEDAIGKVLQDALDAAFIQASETELKR